MTDTSEARRVTEAVWESEARLEALLSSLDDLVFELDEHGTYLGIWTTNDALLAAPRGELLGRTVREALGEELGLSLIRVFTHVLDTGSPELTEFSLAVPAGIRWFQGRVAPIARSGSSPRRICLLVRDITSHKAAEREISRLLSREQLLSRLSEALPVGMFEIDLDCHITFANERMQAIVGHVPIVAVDGVLAEDRPGLHAALAAVLANQPVDDLEIRVCRPEPGVPLVPGTERVCELSLRTLTDANGVVTGAVGCLSDVTDRVQLRRDLEVRASVDVLTSCLNREVSLELVEQMTRIPGEGNALIFIDLDHFKSVNDRFGHAAGDSLLKAAADRLQAIARKGDAVGRVGGDEFIVICPRVESSAQAVRIAERVAAATTATIDVGSGVVDLRTSVGVAWTTEALDADTFLAQADSAMYLAKRARHKGVALFAATGSELRPAR